MAVDRFDVNVAIQRPHKYCYDPCFADGIVVISNYLKLENLARERILGTMRGALLRLLDRARGDAK